MQKTQTDRKLEIALKALLVVFLLVGLIKSVWFNGNRNSGMIIENMNSGSARKEFTNCLNKSGLVMYGEDTCEYCQSQKRMFGSDFENINYHNCQFEQELCQSKGISNYPVWEKDGKQSLGIKTFTELADWSRCKLPQKN